MASAKSSTKRALVDKANSTVVILTSVASFVVIFSLVASRSLWNQMSYQNKVIDAKEKTLQQLETNVEEVAKLENSYKDFIRREKNLLDVDANSPEMGGGDNAKIILDALPSKYDFPALLSSLEYIMATEQIKIESITGTDDQVTQQTNTSSPAPKAVAMPFSVSGSGSYESVQALVDSLQKSIRPFQVRKLVLVSSKETKTVTIDAQSYYQPGKTLSIKKETIK